MRHGFCLRAVLVGVPLLLAMLPACARTAVGHVPDPVQAFVLETVNEVVHMAILAGQTALLLPDPQACSTDRTRDDEASLRATLRTFRDAGMDLTTLGGPAS
ncbi:hypothetical protein [Stenotrophomonas maltophilia]|uniref:hypothetical protein n=1 Tax=Stenotrophomonas maltophilia TaxID=40324 RepID=UPI001312B135|nr:hypothetical protein [Stenotrophomonas maltophilia]MCU1066862.1 hypothetical protein [Stenotrophomonas maltophilia]MCU1073816.1 hypothetical protein [Stenotrophomonas maltophilia]MCU1141301.1 hypothetical protein [Stenotrophomonas maltophilia]